MRNKMLLYFFLDYFSTILVNVLIYHGATKPIVLTQEGTDWNGSRGVKEIWREDN